MKEGRKEDDYDKDEYTEEGDEGVAEGSEK